MSLGGDVLAQPAGDGAAAAADLQAANGRAQVELPDPASGHRVETLGEKVQAAAFGGIGVRERIVACVLTHLSQVGTDLVLRYLTIIKLVRTSAGVVDLVAGRLTAGEGKADRVSLAADRGQPAARWR